MSNEVLGGDLSAMFPAYQHVATIQPVRGSRARRVRGRCRHCRLKRRDCRFAAGLPRANVATMRKIAHRIAIAASTAAAEDDRCTSRRPGLASSGLTQTP